MKTIIFDMDGVLFDTERVYDEAWEIVLSKKGVNNVNELISKCRGLKASDIEVILHERLNGIITGKECIKQLFIKSAEIIKERGVPVKEGVYELLAYLKEHNYEIGLASSTHRDTVVDYLKQTNIYDYFHIIISGDMVVNGKPNPEIYLTACRKFNREPKECIAIEDSINGVKAAISSGMNTIMVPDTVQPTKEIEEKLWKRFDSLIDVKNFIKQIDENK